MRCLFLLALTVAAASALAPYHIPAKNRIQGRYIVVLEDDVDLDSFISRFNSEVSVETMIKRKFLKALNGFVIQADVAGVALNLLRSLPGVRYIEEDEVIHAESSNRSPGSWGIDRIDERTLPRDGIMKLNAYGYGKYIYVIDTGINPYHNDFGGRAWASADMIDGNGIDCDGHGTHCAGTAASTTYGVANEAQVRGIRTLDCNGNGYKSDIIASLEWVIWYGHKPCVASMSLGGSYSNSENEAVKNARKAEIVVVVAAGNSDEDACDTSPASAPDAITVGSTDYTDTRSYFSNYGSCVDLFAPGSNIWSLSYSSNNGVTEKSGTSMACPHVSGIAAALLSMGYSSEDVYYLVVEMATEGVVDDCKLRSPNKLAYCT
ncbi:aqualysin-1-like [Diadema antillarum]|uniref:aqualysin-1-like n=1 Tax=Diadema antillarum TaxID=105358 RepID=UPI003A8AC99A